jgi:hypothetical protein
VTLSPRPRVSAVQRVEEMLRADPRRLFREVSERWGRRENDA